MQSAEPISSRMAVAMAIEKVRIIASTLLSSSAAGMLCRVASREMTWIVVAPAATAGLSGVFMVTPPSTQVEFSKRTGWKRLGIAVEARRASGWMSALVKTR